MRIKARAGDLPFRLFTFPDGQRHFVLEMGTDFPEVTIESRIASADDLFDVLLAANVLQINGLMVSLDIRYLLGARMDRRIASDQPATLAVVARVLNSCGFKRFRILDPHSRVAEDLLGATAVLPVVQFSNVLRHYLPSTTAIVAPDAGATPRVTALLNRAGYDRDFRIVQGLKHRDSGTGALSGFEVQDSSFVRGKVCLIVDDICDGGGTFVGLAKELHKAGAARVDLFVTHGIFSKGLPLEGITTVYTTDSVCSLLWPRASGAIVLKVDMDTADIPLKERV